MGLGEGVVVLLQEPLMMIMISEGVSQKAFS